MIIKKFRIFYTLIPILTIIWISPMIFVTLPNIPSAILKHDYQGLLFVLPAYMAFFILPVYLNLVFYDVKKINSSIQKIIWIRLNLFIAILCSIYGVFIGYMLPFLSPLSAISFFMLLHVLINFERNK